MSSADFKRALKRLQHKSQLNRRRRRAFQKLLGKDYPGPRAGQEWQAYDRLRAWWSRPQLKEFIAMYGTDGMIFPGILNTSRGPSLTEFLHDVGLLAEGEYVRTRARSEMFELVAGKEAARGDAFIQGPKKSRSDPLSRLIEQALPQLPPKATATDVLRKIGEIDQRRVIDHIEPDLTIEWRTPNGKDRTTTFKAFQNRLSASRKKNSLTLLSRVSIGRD